MTTWLFLGDGGGAMVPQWRCSGCGLRVGSHREPRRPCECNFEFGGALTAECYRPGPTPTLDNWERLLWMHAKGSSISLNGGDNGEPWECSWITGGVRYTGVSDDPQMAVADALRHAGVFG